MLRINGVKSSESQYSHFRNNEYNSRARAREREKERERGRERERERETEAKREAESASFSARACNPPLSRICFPFRYYLSQYSPSIGAASPTFSPRTRSLHLSLAEFFPSGSSGRAAASSLSSSYTTKPSSLSSFSRPLSLSLSLSFSFSPSDFTAKKTIF